MNLKHLSLIFILALPAFGNVVYDDLEPSATNTWDLGSSSYAWKDIYGGTLSVATATLTGMTAGSVIFAGTSGLLSEDNASLFWDDTNNYLGILTNSPTAALDVNSDLIRLRTTKTPSGYDDTGNVGDMAWDEDYLYKAVASNQWRRIPWESWDALLLETGDYLLLEDGGHLLLE